MATSKVQHDCTTYNIVIVGDTGVGKSSFSLVNASPASLESLDEQFGYAHWDTKSEDRVRVSFYSKVHGIIIMYDATNRESFENVKNWLKDIGANRGEAVIKLIVGNKCDLITEKIVDFEEAKAFAVSLNISLVEVSAANYINVKEAFMCVISNIHSSEVLNRKDTSNKSKYETITKALYQSFRCFIPSGLTISTTNGQRANNKKLHYLQHIPFPADVCSKAEIQHVSSEDASVNNVQVLVDPITSETGNLSTEANENVDREGNRNPEEDETAIDRILAPPCQLTKEK
ncbi:unnamed protein product [Adineta steineri]|uniref:Uncharacterized protein n=1 Tax=Adineta steineri TaxID=433720 RepID=A0A813N4V6_9BILA|nr:unnamed protein product [Adineta steineri]CAF3585698.1 unnamed protein product [Adineta steineri]